MAKTVPLPCVSAAFVAKTLPFLAYYQLWAAKCDAGEHIDAAFRLCFRCLSSLRPCLSLRCDSEEGQLSRGLHRLNRALPHVPHDVDVLVERAGILVELGPERLEDARADLVDAEELRARASALKRPV